jgi:WD40 repeat protein
MTKRITALLLLLVGYSSAFPAAPPAKGDPLPVGARLRLGTPQLRQDGLRAVAFSPDGKVLASSGSTGVIFWDVKIGREVRRLSEKTARATTLHFTRDGNTLLTANHESLGICVWDTWTGKLLHEFDQGWRSVALSPDGKLLALGDYEELRVVELASGKKRFVRKEPEASRSRLAFAGNETLVLARPWGKKVLFLDAATGKERFTREMSNEREGLTRLLAVSPDGKRIAVSDENGIRVWETKEGRQVGVLDCSGKGNPTPMAFSSDGTKLFLRVTVDPEVLRWDIATGKKSRLPGSPTSGSGEGLTLSADGKVLAWIDGCVIRLQDADTGAPALPGHQAAVHWAVLSHDRRTLVTGSQDATVRFWRADTGQEVRRIPLNAPGRSGLLAPDGKTLVCADGAMVRLWDLSTGKLVHRLPPHGDVTALAAAPGLLAVGSSGDGRSDFVTLWETATGEVLRRFKPHPGSEQQGISLKGIALSPDGKHLATCGNDRLVRTWDVKSEKKIWEENLDNWWKLAYSPDGRVLAVEQDHPSRVLLLDVATGKTVGTLAREEERIYLLCFSPDGRLLATETGPSVTLWDVAERTPVRTLKGHISGVNHASFSADGRQLITSSNDTTALVWDLLPAAQGAPDARRRTQLWADLGGDAQAGHAAASALAASPQALPWLRTRLQAQGDKLDPTRARRVVQALEWMGSPEAEVILASMKSDEAKAALQRLAVRRKPQPFVMKASPRVPRVLQEHDGEVVALAFSPDKRTLASVGNDGRLILADPSSGEVLFTAKAHPGGAYGVAFSPDGKTLATSGADRCVRVWDLARRAETRRLECRDKVTAVAFSPDGKTLAAASYDGRVTLFTLPKFASRSFVVIKGRATGLAFSPDGKTLVVGGTTREGLGVTAAPAKLLDIASAKSRDLGARGSNVAVTPDGTLALVAGLIYDDRNDGFDLVSLCRPESGETAFRIPWRGYALALSGCGRLFATGAGSERHLFPFGGANLIAYNGINSRNTDHSVRIWEVGSGREVLKLDKKSATALTLSPDGRTLAAGVHGGFVLVQDLASAAGVTPEKDLGKLIDALGGEPASAFRAQAALVLAGDKAVRLLSTRVAPVKHLDAKAMDRLIARLNSDTYTERQDAFAELRKMGDSAEPILRRALRGKPDLEMRRRVERLLVPLTDPRLSVQRLRQRRAVSVLQQIGSPAARKVLERLATGPVDAGLTREATAALRQLEREARR